MHSEDRRLRGTRKKVQEQIEQLSCEYDLTVITNIFGDENHSYAVVSLRRKRK